MENKKIVIFSFFSGCGFLDLGFEKNGFDIVFVNEFHKPFMDAYQYSRKKMGMNEPKYGYFNCDINVFLDEQLKQLKKWIKDEKERGNIVGIIGGPPCPDFSIAGKNKGREGDNGKLSLSYTNLIIKTKPDFFLFENVKGLWKTARHREFYEELKNSLSNAGYNMTDRLTNSLEFGAPQDRDRILMFGVHGKRKKLDAFSWERYMVYSLDEVKKKNWPVTNRFVENSTIDRPDGIPVELTVQYWFEKNDVENHPNGKDYFTPRDGLSKMLVIDEGDVSRKSYKRLHRWRYSPTVAYGNNEVHLHPYKARRLSASEAMSLQTLPKEFELPPKMTLTNKFKTVGNGVPFIMSSGIARSIRDYLLGLYEEEKI